jgi:hypothetical protein
MKDKKDQIKALKVALNSSDLAKKLKILGYLQYFDDKQFEIRHQKMRMYRSRMNDESLDKMRCKYTSISNRE